ncbi:integrase-like protein, partial [Yoonia sediminilitoris]
IERWHQTLKNRILLENYFLPGDLEAQIEAFVDHYNHQRHHESINNVTPADVYFGRDTAILKQRERIKRKTLEPRRLHHRQHAAYPACLKSASLVRTEFLSLACLPHPPARLMRSEAMSPFVLMLRRRQCGSLVFTNTARSTSCVRIILVD